MKSQNIFRSIIACLATGIIFTACSDHFLEEKQDYTNASPEIYNDYGGAKSRINDIYGLLLPNASSGVTYDNPSTGSADDYSTSTEEYAGLSIYVDPEVAVSSTNQLPSYLGDESKTSRSTYGRIRNCNDAIIGITNSTLSDLQKKELLGQAYFFRAWCYYRLVKVYGGVPIVTTVQNPVSGDNDGADLFTPRSSTKECIEFICHDLELAASYLPVSWPSTDWGRVTAGTAQALEGRVRLLYASPLFNRDDLEARWDSAYSVNKRAIEKLQQGGFGLAYLDAPGINAAGWGKMFSDYNSIEAVFVTLYNNISPISGTNPNKNNGWENSIRASNTAPGVGGGKTPTANMIDLFPLATGEKPINGVNYNATSPLFMENRDPRFYRTFAFTGVKWAFSGDATSLGVASYPYSGSNYVLWNYCWYDDMSKKTANDQSGFAADGLGTSYKGVYIRKRTDDLDINANTLYKSTLDKDGKIINLFSVSAAPYMEMRYAEVLLNFAESACGAGHYEEAVEALKLIRKRVGYTAPNYGLDPTIFADRAKLFAAILYERQIELAYEGKRFDDMRRWMLWDGGVGQEALKSTWKLTQFGGNTCTYLGVQPLNGQRRDGLEVRVNDTYNASPISALAASDPIKSIRPTAGWNISTDVVMPVALKTYITNTLIRKTKQGDRLNVAVNFKPKYYFIGFNSSIQKNNVNLQQTVGWDDALRGGADGTFDPLAE